MPQIDKVAFFGDSYCFDTITKKHHKGLDHAWYPPTPTYLDIFAEKHNLEIIHRGSPAHGPNWMVHELREWLKSKRQEEINQTHFVFLWSDQSRKIMPNTGDLRPRGNIFEENLHPGERAMPGPDSPMIRDAKEFDQRVRNAIELYWLYLKPFARGSSGEDYRQLQTCRDAWKFYLKQYNITSYQQYHCFFHTAKFENNFLKFEWEGEEHNCLQQFAQTHDDYVMGEGDDHYNHFSPKGQYNMASILSRRFEEIHG
jgi:hypothetical protein|tara:strand:- start:192 stop:959 length:768 start_codon:yes stop_codon:yes gene_type:complete